MAQKILYFTAGAVPTAPEATEIAALRALTEAPFQVLVKNGEVLPQYGNTEEVEDCDYVAGTPPTEYSEYDVYTADLTEGYAIVTDGQVVEITGGSVELTVVDGVITGGTFTADP